MIEEFEKFVGTISITGHSNCVVIPKNIIMFGNYKKGDIVKIMIRKYEKPKTNKKQKDL